MSNNKSTLSRKYKFTQINLLINYDGYFGDIYMMCWQKSNMFVWWGGKRDKGICIRGWIIINNNCTHSRKYKFTQIHLPIKYFGDICTWRVWETWSVRCIYSASTLRMFLQLHFKNIIGSFLYSKSVCYYTYIAMVYRSWYKLVSHVRILKAADTTQITDVSITTFIINLGTL